MEKKLIITEDEKNEILNLHRKFISEQVTRQPEIGSLKTKPAQTIATNTPEAKLQQSTTTQTTTQAPVTSAPIQAGVKNPKVEALQNKLNEKFKSGLVPDGKWGPKTAAAVQKALGEVTTQTTTQAPTTT